MMKSDCLYRNGLCELNYLSLVCWKGCRQNRLAEISSLTWIDSANMNMNHTWTGLWHNLPVVEYVVEYWQHAHVVFSNAFGRPESNYLMTTQYTR